MLWRHAGISKRRLQKKWARRYGMEPRSYFTLPLDVGRQAVYANDYADHRKSIRLMVQAWPTRREVLIPVAPQPLPVDWANANAAVPVACHFEVRVYKLQTVGYVKKVPYWNANLWYWSTWKEMLVEYLEKMKWEVSLKIEEGVIRYVRK